MPSSGKLKPNSIRPCRLLLAWRPTRARNVDVHRALFGVDANRPELIAAWWQGNTLDAKAAADLWARHRWQLSMPAPADVAEVIEQGQQLEPYQRRPAGPDCNPLVEVPDLFGERRPLDSAASMPPPIQLQRSGTGQQRPARAQQLGRNIDCQLSAGTVAGHGRARPQALRLRL
jgi:hypothetical protein